MSSQNGNHGGGSGDHNNHRTRESTDDERRSAAMDAYLKQEWAAAVSEARAIADAAIQRKELKDYIAFKIQEAQRHFFPERKCPRNMFEDP
jgi:hypothetical protein